MFKEAWTFLTDLFRRTGVGAMRESIAVLEDVIARLDARLQSCEERWATQDKELGDLRHVVAIADVAHVNAIVIADDKGVIVEWSEAATKMFLFARGEAIGKSVLLLTPPRFRRRHLMAFNAAVAEKKNWNGKRSMRSGSRVPASRFPSRSSCRAGIRPMVFASPQRSGTAS